MNGRNSMALRTAIFVLLLSCCAAASDKNDFPLTVTVIGADSQKSRRIPVHNNTPIVQNQACAGENVNCTNDADFAASMQSFGNGMANLGAAMHGTATHNALFVEL